MMRPLRGLTAFLAVIAAMVSLSVVVRHLTTDATTRADSPAGLDGRPRAVHDLPPRGPDIIDGKNDASGFIHPGVLVSAGQLEFVRDQIRANAQPWARAFDAMVASSYADLRWQPRAREVVECGYFSDPDHGCSDEWRDGVAAYTHALLWYFTGHEANAKKAVEILDAWSGTLREHANLNAPIQAAWSGAVFARAAEVMRHSYRGWPRDRAERAATMFRTVFLPLVGSGGAPGSWGNWYLTIVDAAVGIAVFLDDRTLFDQAVAMWRGRVPAYIYLTLDGPHPLGPPGGPSGTDAMVKFWFGQGTYVDGLTQETCRDLLHAAWGLEAVAQVAETAWIQGIDLYAEIQPRLVAAMELHSSLAVGDPVPAWLCGGALTDRFEPNPEIAFNHYQLRRGVDLPRTRQLVANERPQSPSNFYAWETLTHGGNPRGG